MKERGRTGGREKEVDQLPKLPGWLPAWGVDGNLRERAFGNAAEAAQFERAGGARLLWLAHAAQVDHLRRKYLLGMMVKGELPRLGVGGTAVEDLIMLAAEGAAGGVLPNLPDVPCVGKVSAKRIEELWESITRSRAT